MAQNRQFWSPWRSGWHLLDGSLFQEYFDYEKWFTSGKKKLLSMVNFRSFARPLYRARNLWPDESCPPYCCAFKKKMEMSRSMLYKLYLPTPHALSWNSNHYFAYLLATDDYSFVIKKLDITWTYPEQECNDHRSSWREEQKMETSLANFMWVEWFAKHLKKVMKHNLQL